MYKDKIQPQHTHPREEPLGLRDQMVILGIEERRVHLVTRDLKDILVVLVTLAQEETLEKQVLLEILVPLGEELVL